MPNFSLHVPGEPEPRGFRYEVEEGALYTDTEGEDPVGGMPSQSRMKITAETADRDPRHLTYWNATAAYREAYRLCEEEGLSLEEAMKRTAVSTGAPSPPIAEVKRPPVAESSPALQEEEEQSVKSETTSPVAGIIITNQQLILGALLVLIDQYVSEGDVNYKLVEYYKHQIEEINRYELTV